MMVDQVEAPPVHLRTPVLKPADYRVTHFRPELRAAGLAQRDAANQSTMDDS
jgi:hypothetical protein